jgi:hypothetical protein
MPASTLEKEAIDVAFNAVVLVKHVRCCCGRESNANAIMKGLGARSFFISATHLVPGGD